MVTLVTGRSTNVANLSTLCSKSNFTIFIGVVSSEVDTEQKADLTYRFFVKDAGGQITDLVGSTNKPISYIGIDRIRSFVERVAPSASVYSIPVLDVRNAVPFMSDSIEEQLTPLISSFKTDEGSHLEQVCETA